MEKLRRVLSRIPLVGQLFEVPPEALKEAGAEILTTTIFAAMPFWFPLIGWAVLTSPPDPLKAIKNGEMLIYAATLVGPLAYIINKRYGKYVTPPGEGDADEWPLSYPFPNGRLSITIAMIICIISGVVITIQKLQESELLKNIKIINEYGLAISSIVLFIVSTILLFCVSANRNFIELLSEKHADRISRAQHNSEESLAAEWQAKREES